jgi:hypothetical protein
MIGFGEAVSDLKSEMDDHSNNSSSVLGGSYIGQDKPSSDEFLPTFGGNAKVQ